MCRPKNYSKNRNIICKSKNYLQIESQSKLPKLSKLKSNKRKATLYEPCGLKST